MPSSRLCHSDPPPLGLPYRYNYTRARYHGRRGQPLPFASRASTIATPAAEAAGNQCAYLEKREGGGGGGGRFCPFPDCAWSLRQSAGQDLKPNGSRRINPRRLLCLRSTQSFRCRPAAHVVHVPTAPRENLLLEDLESAATLTIK